MNWYRLTPIYWLAFVVTLARHLWHYRRPELRLPSWRMSDVAVHVAIFVPLALLGGFVLWIAVNASSLTREEATKLILEEQEVMGKEIEQALSAKERPRGLSSEPLPMIPSEPDHPGYHQIPHNAMLNNNAYQGGGFVVHMSQEGLVMKRIDK